MNCSYYSILQTFIDSEVFLIYSENSPLSERLKMRVVQKGRAERKAEIFAACHQAHVRTGQGLTLYGIAKELDMARSVHLHKIVQEMLSEDLLIRFQHPHRPGIDKFQYQANPVILLDKTHVLYRLITDKLTEFTIPMFRTMKVNGQSLQVAI